MCQPAMLLVLLALILSVSGDKQREEEIRRYYENYYRELYGANRPQAPSNYVPPTVSPADDCEKLHNLIFQTRLGDKEIENDHTFDDIVKILVFKKCDPRTFTKPTKNNQPTSAGLPNHRQNQPAYGQNQPVYGQNQRAYGQNQSFYGQNQPTYGQNQPTYDQNLPNNVQNPPTYDEYVDEQPTQTNSQNGQNRPNNGQVKPSQQGRPTNGQNAPTRKPLGTVDYDEYLPSNPGHQQNRPNSNKNRQNGEPDSYNPDGIATAGKPQNNNRRKPVVTTLYDRESTGYSVGRSVNGKPVFEHHDETLREQGDPAYRPTWSTERPRHAYNNNRNSGWW